MKKVKSFTFVILVILLVGCVNSNKIPIKLSWQLNIDAQCADSSYSIFKIKNISKGNIDNNWSLYFSQMPVSMEIIDSTSLGVESINGNFFRIYPNNNYVSLHKNDSILLKVFNKGIKPNISFYPEGAYWVGNKESKPINVKIEYLPQINEKNTNEQSEKVYDNNEKNNKYNLLLSYKDIIPQIKKIDLKNNNETFCLNGSLSVINNEDFNVEASILKDKLQNIFGLKISDNSFQKIELDYLKDINSINKEYYTIDITSSKISVKGSSSAGIHNGIQTVLSMLKSSPKCLEALHIEDYPDLPYRGFMIDIARNFIDIKEVKKIVDVLSMYKLNFLHLHFCDDEGWRIDIPGIEELVKVGGRRGHTYDEKECLFPAYDGNYDCMASSTGNGFYSRDEFISLLRYAHDRHINIIPEFDIPGHSRAAIVAMKSRYRKYIDTDIVKATEYILSEENDSSMYLSAQNYKDNVMNISLSSTYNFVHKVIDEICKMYTQAEVPIYSIHIGGDEVPSGAWTKSDSCKVFMKKYNLSGYQQLKEKFIADISSYINDKKIKSSAWQETAIDNSKHIDSILKKNMAGIYCWNTKEEWGGDEIPYKIANNGYNVIMCNVNNFYLDLAYDDNINERGHNWGGFINEIQSFSMLPFNTYYFQKKMSDDNLLKKEKLTDIGKKHIIGVQAQLFSETIRSDRWVEYYIFPKILGLVERAWNSHPIWESNNKYYELYEKDLARYLGIIYDKEIKFWNKVNLNYRLPYPGLKYKDGYIYSNTLIKNAKILYTIDGSEPTLNSSVYSKPVKCNKMKAKLFYEGKESVTTELQIK